MTATRLDIISDVSLLQARVTVAEVKDIKVANAVLEKVKRYSEIGLHYRHFETENLRSVCVHDASSASKGRHYAQEGILILLADDKWKGHTIDLEEEFDSQSVKAHGGVMHVLHSHGAKAKRVSYSTSHAETLSMVNALESSTLITTRLTELAHHLVSPTIAQLTELQEHGNPTIPSDFYTDCQDLWELVTGMLTLPQDKSQRLYVLGIREARLCGRIRLFTLVPTQSMLADGLTKPMESHALLLLLSAGKVEMFGVDGHPVKSRVLPTLRDMEENDLLMSDEQVMEVVKPDDRRVKVSHATMMCGLVATSSMKTMGLVLAAALMTTGADAQGEDQRQGHADGDGYTGVYMMMFVTVILAVFTEKIITRMFGYDRNYDMERRMQNTAVIPGIYAQQAVAPIEPTKKRKEMKDEDSATEAMEVDEIYGMNDEEMRKQLMRYRVDLDREKYINQKMLERHKEETDELMDKIHTLRNKTGENDEYTKILAKHKQEFKDKYEKAQKNYDEYYDKYKDFSDKYGDAMQQVANLSDTNRMMDSKIKQQAEKIRQLGDDNAELRNKVVDLFNDYERQKKELKESYEKRASGTPEDERRSVTTPDDREAPEPMDVDEMRDKLDDMKECLDQKTYGGTGLGDAAGRQVKKEKQEMDVYDATTHEWTTTMVTRMAEIYRRQLTKQSMLEVKKKMQKYNRPRYTVMVNDYGDKMSELEKKYKQTQALK